MYQKITINRGKAYRLVHKTWLIMRLTTAILIATLMQVSAIGKAQKITLAKQNAPLKQVIIELRKQSGYDFIVTGSVFEQAKPVSINVKNKDFEEALQLIFEKQPIEYNIEHKNVTLKIKKTGFFEEVLARFQAIDVRGRVLDEKGQPLPGATVKIKRSGKGVLTDAKGEFYLKGVDEGEVLVVSYLGYVTKDVNAKVELGDISLEMSDSKLDEVQVIAYGTTTQRLSTGNVASVKAADIEKQPVNNPLLALQGRVPGLQIVQASGINGAGVGVLIQGQNSLIRGNDPFYVIDGVPFVSQLLPNLGDILGSSRSAGFSEAQNGNPLSFINPADIESIDILKDADATAIYGSRAANGAILITTKKGKAGKTKADFNVQSGIGKVSRKLKLLSTPEYLSLRKEAYRNDKVNEIPASAFDLTLWDQNQYTDWQEELLGGSASYNDAQITLSGGSTNTQFLVGSGYHRETTVFPGDLSDNKASLHFSITNKSDDQRFSLQLSGSFLTDNNKLIASDLTGKAMSLAPNAPDPLLADGSINWAPHPAGISSWGFDNPMTFLFFKYHNKTDNLLGNANVGYQIAKGLSLNTTLGYNRLESNEFLFNTPLAAVPPEYVSFVKREANYGRNKIDSWIIEPQLRYDKSFGSGNLSFLLGSTFQKKNSDRELLKGSGYNSDLVVENINSATSVTVPLGSTIKSEYKYQAIFARLNYNLGDRYIANLTARRDGSTRFGAENRMHNFGAIGAAWIISNEDFLKKLSPVISFAKLRASYGTTGSDQIGDYLFMSLYDNNNPPVPYRGGGSLVPANIANPTIQWEENRKLSVGFDAGLFADRLIFNVNHFRNRSSNQLLTTLLPGTTGPGSITTNLPATVQNTGLEFSASSVNIKNAKVKWTSSFNMTLPSNKLLEFRDLASSTLYSKDYQIGQPISVIRTYKYFGLNQTTGIYEFVDKNGNIVNVPSVDSDNRSEYINTAQKFFGGFGNSIAVGDFELDFLFQFVKQKGKGIRFGNTVGVMVNQPKYVLDRWQNPGDETSVQKYSATNFTVQQSNSDINVSDAAWEDASYIRLKNMSLSWQVPISFVRKLKISNLRVYTQGQNLLTFTKYSGLDPETRSSSVLPPLRVITFGVKASL